MRGIRADRGSIRRIVDHARTLTDMKLEETEETSYPRKYVENIFIGLEDSLNQH